MAAAKAERVKTELEKEYCPPLDTALFLAIAGELSLDQPDQVRRARAVFDALVENVEAEDASGFDPSGDSGLDGVRSHNGDSVSSQSAREWSTNTDDTPLSQGFLALDLDGSTASSAEKNHHADSEKVDISAEEAALIEIFPGLKPFDVKWALRKAKGNASLAIEELLNQVFIEENGGRCRGVDGFSDAGANPRPRKGKWKAKKRPAFTSDATSPLETDSQPSPTNDSRWDGVRRDVEFISSRTRIPTQQVSTMYHSSGASVAATIRSMIAAYAELSLPLDGDGDASRQVEELCADFPSIPFQDLAILVSLAGPSPTAAHQLAEALTRKPSSSPGAGTPIQLEFRLAPLDLSEPSTADQKPYAHNAVNPSLDMPTAGPPTVPSAVSRDYRALRDAAFEQASVAYRRGKSDPLMAGATAYYSSVARDLDERSRAATAAEADALVAAQSSGGILDLHGVTVTEGVRIAREKVQLWWDAKKRRGVSSEGYRIIIGRGKHSTGGRSKLGPAVSGMLIREGWKVEVGAGALVVTGQVGKP